MNDKEWLSRVKVAYENYQEKNKNIELFISWLYKQYGIVEPKKDNK